MRIAIWSNGTMAPTGYGMQTAQLAKRLQSDGHEVAVIANYGVAAAPQVVNGVLHYPVGAHPYSLDVASVHADHFFEGERGLVIVLYDTWPLLEQPDFLAEHDAWYWAPIDHAPPPPKVQQWCKTHNIIAMSEFGADQLAKAGIPPAYTIPHAIEPDVFRPTESDARDLLGVPDDAHLTTVVMANIGQVPIPRKAWFENLLGWRIFAEQHDDAYLYLHTALQHPRGVNLAQLIKMWGLPADRLRVVDQGAYMGGMIGPEMLASLYSASDVTLMATAGEGFGIPAVESQACGVPVIGTDFSAQREVIGSGWKVSFTTMFDYNQNAGQALPEIGAITDALNGSYVASKDPDEREAMRQQAIEHAAQYNADKVYDEHWRPFIADRQPKMNRQQRRAQKKSA